MEVGTLQVILTRMRRKNPIVLIIGFCTLAAWLIVAGVLMRHARERECRVTDRFLKIGKQMVSFLDTASATNPASFDAWVSLGVLSVEDKSFLLEHGVTYSPLQKDSPPDAELLSYPFPSGSRLVYLRSGSAYVKQR